MVNTLWAGHGGASGRLGPARICDDGGRPAHEAPEAAAALATAADDLPAHRHRAPRPRLPGGQEDQGVKWPEGCD